MVLAALPLDAAAVRAHLPQPARHDLPAGTIVEEATLPGTGYNICLACTGPGNGQAAVIAERVINWAGPAAVLFAGIAGTLKDGITLGDVVVATHVVGYQGGKDTLPSSAPIHAKETKEVERRGVELVLAQERELGRSPLEQAFNKQGL